MKKTQSKQQKTSKPRVQIKDLKPAKNAMGGTRVKTADKAAAAMSAFIRG